MGLLAAVNASVVAHVGGIRDEKVGAVGDDVVSQGGLKTGRPGNGHSVRIVTRTAAAAGPEEEYGGERRRVWN